MNPTRRSRLQLLLLLTLAVLTLALGWSPLDRFTWTIEQLLVIIAVLGVALVQRRLRLSASASLQLFGFLVLHQIGAHYTYSRVPYDDAWQALTGYRLTEVLDLQRNHYDRLVHLAYGLLLARPIREVVQGLTGLRGWRSAYVALEFILASSAGYELMEWLGADLLAGDAAEAFVGAQGDPWDAQKDMALAFVGALLSLVCRHGWPGRRGTGHGADSP
ncbi:MULTISPECIES: DUF2238 domain-containing protein [Pseudomonas]|uniref:DUF2238 domain-containing protein n=1 Tax=Pseudomonas benzopyrenica TaxID=2993566 RepID=A0ABZ2FV15_9PSED|nr:MULTISPECIES: DUF2238 domain-containing protein [Pseudomonas]KXJ31676.1 hypothetical protein AX284_02145 [Pseudomonas sp. HUK17]MDC7831456.1 DUF2238 domain-containing protein [Pseudomonas benzopyrenica]